MSTATWGEPESQTDEAHPSALLKHLLQQMMTQFAATGACIALFDESIGQMVIRLHMRSHSTNPAVTHDGLSKDNSDVLDRRTTIKLTAPSSSAIGRLGLGRPSQPLAGLSEVSPQQSEFFPVGTAYPGGQDLIGYVWRKNEPYIMRHEDYLALFHAGRQVPLQTDVTPTWYLATPIQEPSLIDDMRGKKKQPDMLGVVVLYQTTFGTGLQFQQKQRLDAIKFAERIALYLQNDQLQRMQRRTSDYMRRLQQISTTFPTNVKLSNLLEEVYQFATNVVDVSSMLVTLYDRDTNKIYDVFAICQEKRVEGLPAEPVVKESRPLWWRITQDEKSRLLLAPAHLEQSDYDELLKGAWGDQSKAESFLLLPMKMFNRVIGSLCLTSMHPRAYPPEGIQVLETMVQIITVSFENAKLYDKSIQSLQEARQREESLAGMNSALQSISSVLNVNELLQEFVESVARLVQAEMCVFFQLSASQEELIAQALYAPTTPWNDGKELPPQSSTPNRKAHSDLIEMIRLPFKGSALEHLVKAGFFYLDPPLLEDLAQASGEGGAIFLRETNIQKMLMVPVLYQTELVGILAVHTPRQNHLFRPKEVGMLLAICAQAASALRNAQLFEQLQETNAELQRMNKLKDEFLVTASHELRTPLSAISGYSTLLKRQSGRINAQQILRFASKIAGAAQQLADLVSNMTEAANIGILDKKLELQRGPIQLRAAGEMAVNMLSVNIEQQIMMDIGPDLWVDGDPMRIRQVITNLLDNAAKYSPPDGRIEIIARTTTLGQLPLPEDLIDHASLIEYGDGLPVVLVQVHDEGEGILPDDQQKIFEKFVRAPRSLTTPVRGSGLGLYICRRYIEAMGGKLWLEQSIAGEGSVFSFYLPRISAPVETREQDEAEYQTP